MFCEVTHRKQSLMLVSELMFKNRKKKSVVQYKLNLFDSRSMTIIVFNQQKTGIHDKI